MIFLQGIMTLFCRTVLLTFIILNPYFYPAHAEIVWECLCVLIFIASWFGFNRNVIFLHSIITWFCRTVSLTFIFVLWLYNCIQATIIVWNSADTIVSLLISGSYTVLFFDGLVKMLKPQSIKVMRPDLKKRVSIIAVMLWVCWQYFTIFLAKSIIL